MKILAALLISAIAFAQCTVTIVVMPPITSITISPTNVVLQPGQQIQFTATVQ